MAIMVDLNQGWRMPGDTSRVARRRSPPGEIAARLAELDVLWVEEPLAGNGPARSGGAPGVGTGHRGSPAAR